MTLKKRKMRQR